MPLLALSPTNGLLLATSVTAAVTLAGAYFVFRANRESSRASSDALAASNAITGQGELISELRESRREDREEFVAELAKVREEMNAEIDKLRADVDAARTHYEQCDEDREVQALKILDLERKLA